MNKFIFITVFVAFVLFIGGCGAGKKVSGSSGEKPSSSPTEAISISRSSLTGEEPPPVYVQINHEKHQTVRGTYCWSAEGKGLCVDMAGALDLLEGKEPILVEAGQQVTIVMDYQPKPNQVELFMEVVNEEGKEVPFTNEQFHAPTEPGIYYYTYGVWWQDDKDPRITHGDAFYSFALEVRG